MLGAIVGEFLIEAYEQTGEVPTDGTLPDDLDVDGIILRVLGVAQGLRECDADVHAAEDECAYWINELENECAYEGYEPEAVPETVSVQAAPAGLVATDPDDAEALASAVCSGADKGVLEDARALAGAVCLACEGADTERIASYVLSKDLPPASPVLTGTGALLKAESFEEAIEQALQNNFGTEAALAAACMAEPVFGVPDELADRAWEMLPQDLRTVAEDFQEFMLARRAAV